MTSPIKARLSSATAKLAQAERIYQGIPFAERNYTTETIYNLITDARSNLERTMELTAGYSPEYRPASPRAIRPVSPPRGGDLWNMTVSQLRDLARQRGVGGYTGKTKAELVAMLQ